MHPSILRYTYMYIVYICIVVSLAKGLYIHYHNSFDFKTISWWWVISMLYYKLCICESLSTCPIYLVSNIFYSVCIWLTMDHIPSRRLCLAMVGYLKSGLIISENTCANQVAWEAPCRIRSNTLSTFMEIWLNCLQRATYNKNTCMPHGIIVVSNK